MVQDSLHQLYVENHRALMRGLESLRDSLIHGGIPEARAAARELDEAAGPLIAFEQSCLDRNLAEEFGSDLVADLRQGRESARGVVAALLAITDPVAVGTDQRHDWLRGLSASLDHGFHAGTLLSYVDSLDPDSQDALARCLADCVRQRLRWMELPGSGS